MFVLMERLPAVTRQNHRRGTNSADALNTELIWFLQGGMQKKKVSVCTTQVVHSIVVSITEMGFIGSKITSGTRVVLLLTG